MSFYRISNNLLWDTVRGTGLMELTDIFTYLLSSA